jgi:hypothetical protein
MIRTYRELRKIKTFKGRYDYLRLRGVVGESTFGRDRYLNQVLYHSAAWQSVRDQVIIRDDGCDLGIPGYDVVNQIVVHHMNPITMEMIEHQDPMMFDPTYLICTSHNTHMAIHYGDESLLPKPLVVRRPGDTVPWR